MSTAKIDLSSIVTKHFDALKIDTKSQEEQLRPLPNELQLFNTAYKAIKVLPCERLINHRDHFKFENKESKIIVYLTTRDIGYGEYWKYRLLEKIKTHHHELVQAANKGRDNEYYISSFIEPITLFDSEKQWDTTPKDYLTKTECNGYCRPIKATKF